jgi:hypothetical protein
MLAGMLRQVGSARGRWFAFDSRMTRPRTDILLTGTGSLASAILHSFARTSDEELNVVVASRRSDRLQWLLRSAATAAAVSGARLCVRVVSIDWRRQDVLCKLLRLFRPRLVLHTASLQSPWSVGGHDGWSSLIRRAGYGLTLPLHLLLAQRIGQAVAEAVPETIFINACYPDAVNPMLVSDGIPVMCGIGNVGIIAALMSQERLVRPDDLLIVGHHSHVAGGISGLGNAMPYLRAWYQGESIDEEARRWLMRSRLPADQRLNLVTAATGVQVALTLIGRRGSLVTHVPGPLGLPGGYPVLARPWHVSLRLPPGISVPEAVALNRSAAHYDGVVIDDHGTAIFADHARAAILDSPSRFHAVVEPLSARIAKTRTELLIELKSHLLGGMAESEALASV